MNFGTCELMKRILFVQVCDARNDDQRFIAGPKMHFYYLNLLSVSVLPSTAGTATATATATKTSKTTTSTAEAAAAKTAATSASTAKKQG